MKAVILTPFKWLLFAAALVSVTACKDRGQSPDPKELPDLTKQIRPYVTRENVEVRSGPGSQFRAIGTIPSKTRVQVVGKDGDWLLIVSKRGNPPGYIDIDSVRPATAADKDAPASIQGSYEVLANTQVRSGPGLHFPTIAEIKKGTKINVVGEEQGWLKVESKRGNPPGYVETNLTRSLEKK